MVIRYIAYIFLIFAFVSCKNISEKSITNSRPGKNEMADLNRYLVQKDRERIQNYIERKNLKMTESPTGLWYLILKEGAGANFTDSDKVILDYECSLLDGTKCYSSKKLGLKELILGRSEMEPGLNEGLRMLKPGAEAIFIMPAFLAYGLIGDGKMIPSRAIIVYNVNILQTQ
ncbi:MAG: FKBP-type peptidyl-prolyl cis-trans isomerase [Bacteroidia bacterium]|nr:FKBP-type peptidyl-prolyl cis-trans isomerase [Bacteroidia bacterium]